MSPEGPSPTWGRVVQRDHADPATPLLVTGLAAAAILAADGELRLPRETRGGPVEWGGAYGQGVRLTGPWTIEAEVEGRLYELPATLERLEASRWCVVSRHRWGPVTVDQQVLPDPEEPRILRGFELSGPTGTPVRITHRIAPFLAPVLIEGIRPYDFRAALRGPDLEMRAFGSAARWCAGGGAATWTLNGRTWDGSPFRGEIQEISASLNTMLGGSPSSSTLSIEGGVESWLGRHPPSRGPLSSAGAASQAERSWLGWKASAPVLELPEAPALERAYDLALGALRSLYTRPDDEITGLVAGYPWYPALWGRDLAWMLPAVLWLGDLPWAEAALETAFRFQATSDIPLLAAESGEIPMQVSPGPTFLFGTSDTTLHYPALVARYLDHGGRLDTARRWWRHLRAIADWAGRKTDPRTGLLTHGGEAEGMSRATAHIGSVHFGFDAVDTTIWDSTDRRAHAIDVQVLGYRAFSALADLGERLDARETVPPDRQRADRLAEALSHAYRWPEESYLFDSLTADGAPVRRLRPNALLAVSAGLYPREVARAALQRAGAADLTTPWGVRTLSTQDPGFNPTAYHDGQVWTIATAWAAEAAFAAGDPDAGVRYLGIIADRIAAENGLANECYRGDAPEPYDSCFLLGFSIAPFLTVLFERLWGVRRRDPLRELMVAPAFPSSWRTAHLRHLPVAGGRVDLDWSAPDLTVGWSGPGPLRVGGDGGWLSFDGPGTGRLPRPPP